MLSNIEIRPALQEDALFLRQMVYFAALGTGDKRRPDDSLTDAALPDYARSYIEGWKREHDKGVVAITGANQRIGSALYRPLPAETLEYIGLAADNLPSRFLSMGVEPEYRAMGVGKMLLEALIDGAKAERGVDVLALTVYRNNHPARHLYDSAGFVEVKKQLTKNKDFFVMVTDTTN